MCRLVLKGDCLEKIKITINDYYINKYVYIIIALATYYLCITLAATSYFACILYINKHPATWIMDYLSIHYKSIAVAISTFCRSRQVELPNS